MKKESKERIEAFERLYEKYLKYWNILNSRMLNDPIESFDW